MDFWTLGMATSWSRGWVRTAPPRSAGAVLAVHARSGAQDARGEPWRPLSWLSGRWCGAGPSVTVAVTGGSAASPLRGVGWTVRVKWDLTRPVGHCADVRIVSTCPLSATRANPP
ncbi:hypothetical protein N866_17365 [Actinotalea ferrariae CF5-4]|uniref:Uncharacterized protein n=1 Tax=Actinotalea ferrariae CF5-4 TaxID=948458 RepID=A0A021VV38_9CELL|nr:hypothetical protein N866_17365 [Actinotalea ferrariae CF5-4]